MEAVNAIGGFYSFLQGLLSASSLALLNHALQAIFFSTALSHFICAMLKGIGFAYADVVANSRIIQIIGVLVMWQLKIWDHYSGLLYILSVFSMTVVSLYVYDCCGNLSESLDSWRLNNRDWALIFSFLLMFGSTAFVFYSIHSNTESPLQYEYSGIYLLIVVVILIGNMLRRRSVIYTLIGILTMNYLIGSRYLISKKLSDSFLGLSEIPFAVVPYLMMALQAEKVEREKIKS
jgi:hypothetical protein